MTDRIALDRLAVQESVRLLDLARADDWERDTPCTGWTLRRLAAHMTAQHRGFAAAARGEGNELARWR
ncbi:TIGR03086 family protein, partial [Streptomyces sp. SID14478]|uniref:maleylpyruvate isomerase N-terminal domain-containing protein n=1 Tax=Streptomyces sp. SID14478 TaxID=2706073 RepID=UPI0014105A46